MKNPGGSEEATGTQAQPYYGGIQDLRGWAALIVVFYHAHVLFLKPKYFGVELFGGFFSFGHRGVELFFVISGFIMAMLMRNMRDSRYPAGSFFAARAKRIYVPYLPVMLALTSACVFVPGVCPAAYAFDGKTLLMNLLIWPRPDLDSFVPVVAWTLAHEIFFYLMVFVALALGAAGRALLLLWLVASSLLALANVELAFPLQFVLSPFNMAFGLGMLAFLAVETGWPAGRAGLVRWSGAALFLAFGLTEVLTAGLLGAAAERALLIGFFVASFLLVAGFATAPTRRMKLLGDASYSLYLVHYPMLVVAVMLVRRLAAGASEYLLFVLVSAAAVLAGVAYYYLVERPGLRLFGRKI